MSVDQFLNKRYDPMNYNCAHLVCDAWEAETGEPIREALQGFLQPPGARRVDWSQRSHFERLDAPRSPCLVLMDRPKTTPHVGIYLRGRVLHITEAGVQFMPVPIATYGYRLVRYYGYANCHNC